MRLKKVASVKTVAYAKSRSNIFSHMRVTLRFASCYLSCLSTYFLARKLFKTFCFFTIINKIKMDKGDCFAHHFDLPENLYFGQDDERQTEPDLSRSLGREK